MPLAIKIGLYETTLVSSLSVDLVKSHILSAGKGCVNSACWLASIKSAGLMFDEQHQKSGTLSQSKMVSS